MAMRLELWLVCAFAYLRLVSETGVELLGDRFSRYFLYCRDFGNDELRGRKAPPQPRTLFGAITRRLELNCVGVPTNLTRGMKKIELFGGGPDGAPLWRAAGDCGI